MWTPAPIDPPSPIRTINIAISASYGPRLSIAGPRQNPLHLAERPHAPGEHSYSLQNLYRSSTSTHASRFVEPRKKLLTDSGSGLVHAEVPEPLRSDRSKFIPKATTWRTLTDQTQCAGTRATIVVQRIDTPFGDRTTIVTFEYGHSSSRVRALTEFRHARQIPPGAAH
jgi:hypothetical protein